MSISTHPVNPWIRVHRRRPDAMVRLVCLPHAGGAASFFRDWGPRLPEWVELRAVQYPGREDRLAEELIGEIGALADGVAEAVAATCVGPVALFGHSMGAAVAYETARRLARDPAVAPVALYVSACPAPGPRMDSALHELSDDGLAADLLRQGATDPAVLADPELREIVLDVVRNDYRLIETYETDEVTALPVPVTAFCPQDDDTVDAAGMANWERATARAFSLRRVPGDHFYLVPGRDALLRTIANDLEGHVGLR
ncbi:alpha/beta fold hydrolase [Spongiactinospora sp. TRM90649]|uniref:thioesterase II family protein n=1 Tax=Spongiactinospora sp. TRM90649 TaxID=3031114 RepID=UPI0023FA2375|nr:alpha/beta fold hydrolase [Spongiactinospora sp. TRM90649]MDF5758240.1 alpha/beta fold hydrolase [Spongiactinospora sp. TRM90649]